MNNKFFFPSKRSNIDSFKVMQLLSDANNLENQWKKGLPFRAWRTTTTYPFNCKK